MLRAFAEPFAEFVGSFAAGEGLLAEDQRNGEQERECPVGDEGDQADLAGDKDAREADDPGGDHEGGDPFGPGAAAGGFGCADGRHLGDFKATRGEFGEADIAELEDLIIERGEAVGGDAGCAAGGDEERGAAGVFDAAPGTIGELCGINVNRIEAASFAELHQAFELLNPLQRRGAGVVLAVAAEGGFEQVADVGRQVFEQQRRRRWIDERFAAVFGEREAAFGDGFFDREVAGTAVTAGERVAADE